MRNPIRELSQIPQPPSFPLLYNLPLIERTLPVRSFILLAKTHGEIFQMRYPSGPPSVYLNSHALVSQVCDDSRFEKTGNRVLNQARDLVGDALLTAFGDEPRWGMAHRILMPAFSPSEIRDMFGDMKDICDQLLLKWDRVGPEQEIDLVEDLTRLSFDSIGLCTMSQRFNSFYSSSMPEFTQCVTDFTTETVRRAFRPSFVPSIFSSISSKLSQLLSLSCKPRDKYDECIAFLLEKCQKVLDDRRMHSLGNAPNDVLTRMIEKSDVKTGKNLPDDCIIKNLITFLVAGHETTSSTLSFALYFLLTNPSTITELQVELDKNLGGGGKVNLDNLENMEYLKAVLRETLRLAPVAFFRTVSPKEDVFLSGGSRTSLQEDVVDGNIDPKLYHLKKGTTIVINTPSMHRDPCVWGSDADEFRPARMLTERFATLPKNAWQPFGFGVRACIGRPFAMQECLLFLASLFYHFDVSLSDPGYQLDISQTITLNTRGMKVLVKRREGRPGAVSSTRSTPQPSYRTPATADFIDFSIRSPAVLSEPSESPTDSLISSHKQPRSSQHEVSVTLHILYGSNSGTCEFLAKRAASDARNRGYIASVGVLDSRVGQMPRDGPLLIITSSYEGEPPDNAASFVSWLEGLTQNNDCTVLSGVRYAVFGCGNREWARTYQRIPSLLDNLLDTHGARRLVTRGEGDAASLGMFETFNEYMTKLWKILSEFYSVQIYDRSIPSSPNMHSVDILPLSTKRMHNLLPEAKLGRILEIKTLTTADTTMKCHIEIHLPEGTKYKAGDYLMILPSNPSEVVNRVLSRFNISQEQEVAFNASSSMGHSIGCPIQIRQVLYDYVEVGQPATRKDLDILLEHAKTPVSIDAIKSYIGDHSKTIAASRISVLTILETLPDIQLSFSTFLLMLPPMRPRQYSISSSPLLSPQRATLTISVYRSKKPSSLAHPIIGVASGFLSSLAPGSLVPLRVRASPPTFHLPADISVPVMMFAVGSGIAPFRGFIEERAVLKAEGNVVGRMVLFFGCRSPDMDYLYSDSELKAWVDSGVVDVRTAFSRQPDASLGCTYVQERVWHDRDLVREFYGKDAKFFACGTRRIISEVEGVFKEILRMEFPTKSAEEVQELFDHMRSQAFSCEVFS